MYIIQFMVRKNCIITTLLVFVLVLNPMITLAAMNTCNQHAGMNSELIVSDNMQSHHHHMAGMASGVSIKDCHAQHCPGCISTCHCAGVCVSPCNTALIPILYFQPLTLLTRVEIPGSDNLFLSGFDINLIRPPIQS